MKKIMAMIAALSMAVMLCACHVSTSVTETTTSTDADGNTVTTTTTTTTHVGSYPDGSCGAAAEDGEKHQVNVSITNNTDKDITGIYMVVSGSAKETNLIEDGNYLSAGGTAEDYIKLTYNEDSLFWDLGIEGLEDGKMINFDGIDISDVDASGFAIEIGTGDDGGYEWTIKAQYIKG